MPSDWYGGVTLIDYDSKKTSLRFTIGTLTGVSLADEAQEAYNRMDGLIDALKAVTDANVSSAFLRMEDPGDWADEGLPSDADVSDEAVISVHTNDSLREAEVDQLRIPGPKRALWVNSNPSNGLNKTNSDLQAYVALFEEDFMFSDGEHVNTDEGTEGIAGGYWRSVKKAIRKTS